MRNHYIVRMADNRLFSFYHSETSGIVLRSFEGGRWSKPEPVAPDAQSNFTVSVDENGAMYMFAQDEAGDVHLYRYRRGDWKSRIILKNPGERQTALHIYPMICDGGMSIIYNHASGADGGALMLQSMDDRGKWRAPASIDSYTPSVMPFSVQTVTPTHSLLFYAKKSAEPAIGYVEVSPERVTAFNTIYTSNHRIIDTSFLVTNDSLHALFIVKTMFSCQLIYRKKSTANFSAPVILADGAQLSGCLLMFVSGKLMACFMSDGRLVCSSSSDHGETFSRPVRYTNKFCAVPVKSVFLSQSPMDTGKYFVRQLYVDRNNVSDIQLLPDVYEDFYPLYPSIATEEAARQPDGSAALTEAVEDEISVYRDKLEISRLQLVEKERQMSKLTQANEEEQKRLKERIKTLEDELRSLRNPPAPKIEYPLMIVKDQKLQDLSIGNYAH